jgi:hypothetical protein
MNLDDFVRALNLGEEDLNDLGLGSQALLPTRRNCRCPTQKKIKNQCKCVRKNQHSKQISPNVLEAALYCSFL